jgi:16S rRNA A1518/A1519 N6-dimethyltransferase RsmA/KsgA/DIM1 with predicted DNA glycosylase/AP lyase activity
VNEAHAACGGDEWRAMMRSIVPSTIGSVDLGDDVLEVGPGYGAATDVVCELVPHLTAVEIDVGLVELLQDRFAEQSHVEIIHGDATSLSFADERFSGAICFTMFHHVPSTELQDRVLAEIRRVLRSGAALVASDNLASDELAAHHEGDTYNPVDPKTLAGRLEAAGFGDVTITTNPYAWRAIAYARR